MSNEPGGFSFGVNGRRCGGFGVLDPGPPANFVAAGPSQTFSRKETQWLEGGFGVALVWLWYGFKVALGSQSVGYQLALRWL